jgi:hypothetical protein
MTAKDPLIITDEIQPGQKFEHDGSIIFKVFVPDSVEAKAKDGGLRLEQGGGDNLKLSAYGGATAISSGVVIRGNGGVQINNFSGGSISVINNRVFIDGKEVKQDFNNASGAEKFSGVEVKGALGNEATIRTDGSVNIGDAGQGLDSRSDGSFSGGNIGAFAVIRPHGSAMTYDVGAFSEISSGGSLTARSLGAGGTFNAGGSATVGNVGPGVTLQSGGSMTASVAQKGASLRSGGSMNVSSAEDGVGYRAGGSMRVNGERKKSGSSFRADVSAELAALKAQLQSQQAAPPAPTPPTQPEPPQPSGPPPQIPEAVLDFIKKFRKPGL